MKICIPSQSKNNLDSYAYGHFGSAPYFLVYDVSSYSYEFLNNSESNPEHGKCNPIQSLVEKQVDAAIVFGMGQRALSNLTSLGIKVFMINDTKTLKEIVENFNTLELKELTINDSCNHNEHHAHISQF